MGEISGLDIFYIIGTSTSLISVFGAILFKLWQKYKKKREKVEQAFNQEMERFIKAGSTVSARTDLGFFFQMELDSLYELSNEMRHLGINFLFVTIIFMIFSISFANVGSDYFSYALYDKISKELADELFHKSQSVCIAQKILMVFSFLSAALAFLAYRNAWTLTRDVESYKDRIQKIWQEPVEKRLPTPENPN
jgi:hypothetical protein